MQLCSHRTSGAVAEGGSGCRPPGAVAEGGSGCRARAEAEVI